jgi:hypothetical protein
MRSNLLVDSSTDLILHNSTCLKPGKIKCCFNAIEGFLFKNLLKIQSGRGNKILSKFDYCTHKCKYYNK